MDPISLLCYAESGEEASSEIVVFLTINPLGHWVILLTMNMVTATIEETSRYP